MTEITEKAQLKKYRHVPGIYMFVNTINNKKYIGQANDLNARLLQHFSCIRRKKTTIPVLYRAIYKHGLNNFKLIILTTFPPHKKLKYNLNLAEKIYISFYDTFKNGYNCTKGGDGVIGRKWSKEQKSKQSSYVKNNPIGYHGQSDKPVYMYNYKTGEHFNYKSVAQAGRELRKAGYNIKDGCISQNAIGRSHRVSDFISSYDKNELNYKIDQFNKFIKRSKYRSIHPDYNEYFNWLLTIADDTGLIPAARIISEQLGVRVSSIQAWNRTLCDKLENVRIGTIDRKRIINYDQYKSKKTDE